MPSLTALRDEAQPNVTLPTHVIADVLKASPDFMEGVRQGVAAYKQGEITPWAEVEQELGLG